MWNLCWAWAGAVPSKSLRVARPAGSGPAPLPRRRRSPASERRRRHRVAEVLAELRRQWIEQPRVPVEAPSSIVNQEFANLPDGVELTPGKVTVSFRNAQEGLEKLLALAMAIGNDVEGFERRTAIPDISYQLGSG